MLERLSSLMNPPLKDEPISVSSSLHILYLASKYLDHPSDVGTTLQRHIKKLLHDFIEEIGMPTGSDNEVSKFCDGIKSDSDCGKNHFVQGIRRGLTRKEKSSLLKSFNLKGKRGVLPNNENRDIGYTTKYYEYVYEDGMGDNEALNEIIDHYSKLDNEDGVDHVLEVSDLRKIIKKYIDLLISVQD